MDKGIEYADTKVETPLVTKGSDLPVEEGT